MFYSNNRLFEQLYLHCNFISKIDMSFMVNAHIYFNSKVKHCKIQFHVIGCLIMIFITFSNNLHVIKKY